MSLGFGLLSLRCLWPIQLRIFSTKSNIFLKLFEILICFICPKKSKSKGKFMRMLKTNRKMCKFSFLRNIF